MRLDGLERFQEMLRPILLSLEDISNNFDGSYKSEARSDASGLLSRICAFGFWVNLVIARNMLQKRTLDILCLCSC